MSSRSRLVRFFGTVAHWVKMERSGLRRRVSVLRVPLGPASRGVLHCWRLRPDWVVDGLGRLRALEEEAMVRGVVAVLEGSSGM